MTLLEFIKDAVASWGGSAKRCLRLSALFWGQADCNAMKPLRGNAGSRLEKMADVAFSNDVSMFEGG